MELLQCPIRELKPPIRTHAVLNRRARISINDVQNVQNALQALEKQAQFSVEQEQPPAHQHSEEPEEEIDLGEQEEQEEQEEEDDEDDVRSNCLFQLPRTYGPFRTLKLSWSLLHGLLTFGTSLFLLLPNVALTDKGIKIAHLVAANQQQLRLQNLLVGIFSAPVSSIF